MTTDAHQYLTPQELADLIRVPLATVYGWRHKGEGPPCMKVGRHLRYRLRDVEAWLDGLVSHDNGPMPRPMSSNGLLSVKSTSSTR